MAAILYTSGSTGMPKRIEKRWGAFDVFPLSVAQMDALIAAR